MARKRREVLVEGVEGPCEVMRVTVEGKSMDFDPPIVLERGERMVVGWSRTDRVYVDVVSAE